MPGKCVASEPANSADLKEVEDIMDMNTVFRNPGSGRTKRK